MNCPSGIITINIRVDFVDDLCVLIIFDKNTFKLVDY